MSKKKTAKVLQYTAVFEPDSKSKGYSVTIPALPGCISEGDSFEAALVNIKEAASLYLEDLNNLPTIQPNINPPAWAKKATPP